MTLIERSKLGVLLCATVLAAGCGGSGDDSSPLNEELIAFSSKPMGNENDVEIYTMRPDGSNVTQLTHNGADIDDSRPLWSPDGRWIAFMSTVRLPRGPRHADIYVMRRDGSEQTRLSENELAELLTGWTNDGRIVFWRCHGDSVADCELRVVDRDGSDEHVVYESEDILLSSVGPRGDNQVRATSLDPAAKSLVDTHTFAIDVESGESLPVADEGLPSPDGRHLLTESDRDKNGPCLFHDCVGYAPELYADNIRLTHTTGYESEPAWSPGGERIVFARIANDDGDDYELWVMNANGTCETQLTDDRRWDVSPDWYGPAASDHPLSC